MSNTNFTILAMNIKRNLTIFLFTLMSTLCLNAYNVSHKFYAITDNVISAKNIDSQSFNIDSKPTPVLVFTGKDKESVTLNLPPISDKYRGIKIEALVCAVDKNPDPKLEDVYQAEVYQIDSNEKTNKIICPPARSFVSQKPFEIKTVELESCYQVKLGLPISIKIERKHNDPFDSYKSPTALIGIKITPVKNLPTPYVVENCAGYNSWPMMQASKDKLVCIYSRGSAHTISQGSRDTYVRVSSDAGKTWSPEKPLANDQIVGEVPIGKGLDENGDILFWIRFMGKGKFTHNLFRTKDGVTFEKITSLKLSPMPMQITDVFHVPTVGMMALWFTGNYGKTATNSWGTLVSKDNGKTWKQTVIESGLDRKNWSTEPSAVYLGDGKILGIARVEHGTNSTEKAQFQLQSNDYGKTWTRTRTNITDIHISTPSLIFDKETGLVYNYYYQRGRGMLKRRVVKTDEIWNNPLAWPNPEIVAFASAIGYDAGNVNTTVLNGKHYLAIYSGDRKNTSVLVSEAEALKK